jgi:hypothetical protein
VTAAALPSSAAAEDTTSVVVNSNVGSTYLNGGTLSGSFDINAALPDNLFQQPYDIVSATMMFYFHDDGDPYSQSTTYNGQSWAWNGDGYNYYNRYTVTYTDPSETAFVTAGANSGSASTSLSSTYNGSSTQLTGSYAYNCGWSCSHDYYYNVNTQYTNTYAGSFSLTQALTFGSLTDLATDGVLNWSINGSGDFIFDGATLNATVAASPVPEPASLILLGSGLSALAVRARRRRGNTPATTL